MEILRNRWKQMQLRLLLSVSVLMGIGAGFPKEAWAEMEETLEGDTYHCPIPDGCKPRAIGMTK